MTSTMTMNVFNVAIIIVIILFGISNARHGFDGTEAFEHAYLTRITDYKLAVNYAYYNIILSEAHGPDAYCKSFHKDFEDPSLIYEITDVQYSSSSGSSEETNTIRL